MKTRQDAINFCLSLKNTYEDYPFRDHNWTIMRHNDSKKMFAAIYERQGNIWINVKCDPMLTYMWRSAFDAVVPAYHMNKWHWNSIILDGSIPCEDIMKMVSDSYELTKPKRKGKKDDK
ncbi:MAG: MmcQ/YjbR family DNA-binding protein [Clostridia bacterium]|nr:MmcQ/YjbR family DNA-binding protein [Clostridia bacterium]